MKKKNILRAIIILIMFMCLYIKCININKVNISVVNDIKSFSKNIQSLSIKDNLQSKNNYTTKRLIVTSDNNRFRTLGAEYVIAYNNIYVLSYDSTDACEKAYNTLSESNNISVEVDSILKTTDNGKSNEETEIKRQETELKKYLDSKKASKEIKVAIIDTGIDLTDTKFKDRIIDLKTNLSSTGKENSIQDDNGHGTEMADIICSNSSNMVKVMPIKVANSDGKTTILSTYIGIQKAIDNNADIISISMNTYKSTESLILTDIINQATSKGIKVIVSAGNEGTNTNTITPADIESAIVVSSVGNSGNFEGYSNYGDTIDYSSYGNYKNKCGTSYSAANLAGIIADVLSKGEDASVIDKYTIDLGDEGKDIYYGKGLVDLYIPSELGDGKVIINAKDTILNMPDFKLLSNEEINKYIGNSEAWQIGYYLSDLPDSDFKQLLARDTTISHEITMYDFVNSEKEDGLDSSNEQKMLYYKYCIDQYNEYKQSLRTSAAEVYNVTTGYYTLDISWYNRSTGSAVIYVVFDSTAQGNRDLAISTTAANRMYFDPSGTTSGFAITEGYIRKAKNMDTYSLVYTKANITLPAYCYFDDGGRSVINTGYTQYGRLNFNKYDANHETGDGGTSLVGASDVATTDTTQLICMQANVHQLGIGYNPSDGYANCHNHLTLKICRHTHTVSTDEGTGISSTSGGGTYYYGDSVTISAATNTGYHFDKWTGGDGTLGSATQSYTFTMPDQNISCRAHGAINSSTLYIDPNGGTLGGNASVQTYTQNYNTTLAIADPVRTGYTFTGWQYSYGFNAGSLSGTTFTFGDVNGGSGTLTAGWQINKYYIDVNVNLDDNTSNTGYDGIKFNVYINGSLVKSSVTDYCQQSEYGSTYKVEMIASSDHTYSAAEYSGTLGAGDIEVIVMAATKPTVHRVKCVQDGNDNFYAYAYVTSPGTISSVKFPAWTDENGQDELNWHTGETCSASFDGQEYNYRSYIKSSDHARAGTDQHNWYNVHVYGYDKYGGYKTGGTTFNFVYRLSFDYNKPSNASHDITDNSTGYKDITYKNNYGDLPNPKLVGWKFKGWYTSSSGGTQVSSSTNYNVPYGVTVYAHWEPIKYTIRFNGNGNWNTSQGSYTQIHTYDTPLNLTENKFTRADATTYNNIYYIRGYQYIGWGLTSEQKTADYSNKQSVMNLTTVDGATIDFYALWKKDIYLSINFSGGKYNNNSSTEVLNYTMYNSELNHTFDIKPYYGTVKTNGYSNKGLNDNLTKTDSNDIQYRFLGYSLNPNRTVPDTDFDVFAKGTRIENYTLRDNGALYAAWEPILQMTVSLSAPQHNDVIKVLNDVTVDNVLGHFKILKETKSSDISNTVTSSIKSESAGICVTNKDNVMCTVSAKGGSPITFKSGFDSRILDIYSHGKNNTWYDTLNNDTEFNSTITNFTSTVKNFKIPKYLGTEKSYKTSNPNQSSGSAIYGFKLTCTKPSYYYNKYWKTDESVSTYCILFLKPNNILNDNNTFPKPATDEGIYYFQTVLD